MAQAPSSISFNSSRLVRFLADLGLADVAESKQSFAERLGAWLDLADAISLSAALKSAAAREGQGAAEVVSAGLSPLHDEFERVKGTLLGSIGLNGEPMQSNVRMRIPLPAPGTSIETMADYSPYHRYHLALQREMETAIVPLRASVRDALSLASPALKQLAALDAVLDEAFRARERNLFASLPFLVEKRFGYWRRNHLDALAEAQASDDPEKWMQPGAWLHSFCQELQGVLAAELDLRLQPVAGLLEAYENEVTKYQ